MVRSVGFLHAEASCDFITNALFCFHHSKFFINMGDFYSNNLDMVIEKESIQIPKFRVAQTGSMRHPMC